MAHFYTNRCHTRFKAYYLVYRPDFDSLKQTTRETFKTVHDDHWHIECFHRALKQVCNIECFYVRDEQAIRNHFFCALHAFCQLQTMVIKGVSITVK